MQIDFKQYDDAINMIFVMVESCNPTHLNLKETMEAKLREGMDLFISWGKLPSELRNPDVFRDFVDELCADYKLKKGVVMAAGNILEDTGHKPWLETALQSGAVSFEDGWLPYKKRLEKVGFNQASLAGMDKITNDVLDHMGDPRSTVGFKTFGLLMGDVQSGKTATFTGICHKAVDAGYRLIVVLTGTKSSLRTQTQNRLNADLIGQLIDSKGVRRQIFSSRKVIWNPLTSPEQDFTKSKTSGVSITPDNPNQVSIAVMQKNGRVLRNFCDWLDNNEQLGIRNLPLFFVDDEADQASINVNKSEDNPTSINKRIREILEKFDRSAYLAVTATPFANVFIDPQLDEATGEPRQDVLPDLFPKDYVYAIPTPLGYLGVERLFGELGEVEENSFKYRALIPMTPEEDGEPDDVNVKTLEGRLRADDHINQLPHSLRTAVLYFLCACTYGNFGTRSRNMSMLVHIARYRKVQGALRTLIEQLVNDVRQYAESENGRIPVSEDVGIYGELRRIWDEGVHEEKYFEDPTHGSEPPSFRELTGLEWKKVWKSRFRTALKSVQVVEANTNSKIKNFAIYYEKNNARLIAVGGDALSRGLTLEGLCVSYFARRSFAYDSLLQMGRWFGYREEMRDFMKVWISDNMVQAFGYVADALSEFRELVEDMRRKHMSPSQFGLKIRVAPKNVRLMITAANKMRSSKRYTAYVDFTGVPYQASTFCDDESLRKQNRELVSSFLRDLGSQSTNLGRRAPEDATSGAKDLVWENVPAVRVSELLQNFACPSWSDDLDIVPVAKKIGERDEEWMVRVISLAGSEAAGRPAVDLFGLGEDSKIICSERTIVHTKNRLQQPNRGILGSIDFGRHLTRSQKQSMLENERTMSDKEINALQSRHVLREPDQPPQLIVYAIDPIKLVDEERRKKYEKEGVVRLWTEDETLITLAFAVPGTGAADKDRAKVIYEANRIYQMNGYLEDEE